MRPLPIKGYCDRPSARPGERLDFYVSLPEAGGFDARLVRLIAGDRHPGGPGPRLEEVDHPVAGRYAGGPQRTQSGSYVEVADPDGRLHPAGSFAVHAFVWPTNPAAGDQAVLSRWDAATGAGWALRLRDGTFTFTIGDGAAGEIAELRSPKPVLREVWYSVAAAYDADEGTLRLSQRPVVNRVNSRFGPVTDYDGVVEVSGAAGCTATAARVPVLIGGVAEAAADGGRTWVREVFNGKLDSPQVLAGTLDERRVTALAAGDQALRAEALAAWDFAAGIGGGGLPGDQVADTSGSGLDGRCVNQPDQAMTGWNWSGEEDKFIHAPAEYGAMWFHDDSLDDARWERSLELEIPAELPSGCYALRLDAAAGEEGEEYYVPFFVPAPRERARAPVLVLIPTYSYVAYANSQVYQNAPEGQLANGHITVLEDTDFELNAGVGEYGLSCYDTHSDGKGVGYSTWRRPLLSLQPGYQHEFGAVWQFPADLHLIDWLERQGFECDVATDHDLAAEGAELLSRYQVVISGTHPEYYSASMFDAWEDYLAGGGRGMYLGGNGFYWVTSAHPDKPWLIEVRRGESGDAAWRSRPGEMYHSTTGEKGGLWRYRARAPQKIWGTGYTSHTMAVSGYYVQMPDSRDPRAAWIMEGIPPEDTIGDFGLINEGAAGLEVDRLDLELGTPPNTLLLASSVAHGPNAMLVPEELFFAHPAGNGDESPLVRGDIVYFTTPNGGGMFSTSSMSWCGSLSFNGGDNNVSRLTANVVRRFADPNPLEPLV
jgi:N,N-dimethylformamidase